MRLFCRCPSPSESCRLVLSTQQKFLASPQFLVLRRGEERTLALNSRRGQGTTSCNFPSLLPFAMKRKQKRFLQMTLLFMVALIFLPNVGLWSLYKEKHLVKSAEPGEQQVSTVRRRMPGGWSGVQLPTRRAGAGAALGFLLGLCRAGVTSLRDGYEQVAGDRVTCEIN